MGSVDPQVGIDGRMSLGASNCGSRCVSTRSASHRRTIAGPRPRPVARSRRHGTTRSGAAPRSRHERRAGGTRERSGCGARRDWPGGDRPVRGNPDLPEHVEEAALVSAARVLVVVLHRVEADDSLAAARAIARKAMTLRNADFPRVVHWTTVRAERLRLQTQGLEVLLVHG
jgi:hypothetical protein